MLATRLSVVKASQAIRWVRLSLRVFYKAKISILGCILISLSYNLKQRPHPIMILRCSFEHKYRTIKSLYPLWLYILYQVKKKLEVTWKHDPRVWLFVRSYLPEAWQLSSKYPCLCDYRDNVATVRYKKTARTTAIWALTLPPQSWACYILYCLCDLFIRCLFLSLIHLFVVCLCQWVVSGYIWSCVLGLSVCSMTQISLHVMNGILSWGWFLRAWDCLTAVISCLARWAREDNGRDKWSSVTVTNIDHQIPATSEEQGLAEQIHNFP